jgi:hypothetical protein
MASRRLPHLAALLLAASLAASADSARAGLVPEMVAALGSTAAVAGEPGGGGVTVALSLLWPLEDRFRAGFMGFADDLGQRADRLVAGGKDLGPVPSLHRQTAGVAWRIEGALRGRRYEPYACLTWGLYHATDDVIGARVSSRTSAGLGAGLGIQRNLSERHAAGLSLRYQKLTRGISDQYLSAAFEWRWRAGAPASAPVARADQPGTE